MKLSGKFVACGTACAALFLTASPVAAAPPGAAEVDFILPGTDDVGEDGYCAFPVRIVGFNNQRFITTPSSPMPGDTVTTRFLGAAVVTAVNTESGESARFNVSGPGTTVTAPDGSFRTDATGPQLSLTTLGNSFEGVSPLSFTTGRVFFEVGADGMTTGYGLKGRAVDVCEVLS
jgi:hypothetical protein